MVSIQRTFLGHISHRWLDQCIPSSDLTISVQGKAKSWLDVLVLILFLIQHAHVSDVPAEPPSLFLERCVSLAICVVPRIDGRRCAHVTSSDGNDQRPADAPLPVVHVRTERREEMGRRLTRCRVRRAVGRTAPFEHGVRVVLATSTFNVRSTQRLATRVAFPILFPSGSSDEYTDRACTRIPIRENIFITNRRRSTRTYTFLPCIAYFGSELDVSDSYRTAPFVEGKRSPGQHHPGFLRVHVLRGVQVRRCRRTERVDIQY